MMTFSISIPGMETSQESDGMDSPPQIDELPSKPCFHALRHAESEYNIGNYDIFDAPLTDNGRIQASHLSGHFDIVLCSPLSRALETLQCSMITCDKFVLCNELREFKMAKADFFPFESVLKETFSELQERFDTFLIAVVQLLELGYSVLAIGHHQWFKRFSEGALVLKNAEMGVIEINTDDAYEPAVKLRKIGK